MKFLCLSASEHHHVAEASNLFLDRHLQGLIYLLLPIYLLVFQVTLALVFIQIFENIGYFRLQHRFYVFLEIFSDLQLILLSLLNLVNDRLLLLLVLLFHQ